MNGKYMSLTSYKRDGTGVATPVWFVQEDGRILVKTDGDSYKVKRITRNPSVTVAECTASGRLRSEPIRAFAEVLPGSEAQQAEQLMARKYRLDRIIILPIYRAVEWLRGHRARGADSVFLAIKPDQPS
jgi:uncharacterized protein